MTSSSAPSRIKFSKGTEPSVILGKTTKPAESSADVSSVESMMTPKIVIEERDGSHPLTRKLDIGLPPPGSGGYRNEEMETILEKMGVPPVRVRYAMARKDLTNEHLSQIMRDYNFLSFENVAKALAILTNLDFFPSENIAKIDPTHFEGFREHIPIYQGFAPIHFDGTHLIIAVSDASGIAAAGSRFYEYKTKVVIAAESTIQMVYRRFFSSTEMAFHKLLEQYVEIEKSKNEDLENHPGLLRDLLGSLLRHACTLKVSDIHMHMTEYVGLIKLTVDGVSNIFRAVP